MPLEPGVARKIIGARQRHRRRRHEPGSSAIRAPGAIPGGTLSSSIDSRSFGGRPVVGGRTTIRVACLATRWSTVSTLPVSSRDDRPRQPRLGDPGRSRPDQRAADRRRERKPAERPSRPSAARARSRPVASAAARQRNACPLPRLAEREPRRDAAPEPDDRPTAEAARARPRGASQAPRRRRKTASSNSPEHAVEEALPLC